MFFAFKKNVILANVLSIAFIVTAHASGMLPETSVVILREVDGETSMNVTNTDPAATLLYTTVQTLPEDPEQLLVVTPPVTRVEPNETQLVRFILQRKEPLKVQRLERVIFEGIPQKTDDNSVKVTMNVRQNLPVIIHPKNLPISRDPWTLLTWALKDGNLNVDNNSPYVVRLAQLVLLLPQKIDVDLAKTYILPGQHLSIPVTLSDKGLPTTVRISPATVYGFSVDTFDAPLVLAK